jgi:hypothetical protein
VGWPVNVGGRKDDQSKTTGGRRLSDRRPPRWRQGRRGWPRRHRLRLKEICPRGNNNIVIIIFLVHDNVCTPC